MQVGEGQSLDEFDGGSKIGVSLARKPHDHVRPDGRVGQKAADQIDPIGVKLGAIPAMHCAQDAVATGLQRDMKMARQAIRATDQRYEVFGNVLRFNRAEAELPYIGLSEDPLGNTSQCRAWNQIAAITSQVDAAEHDFLRTCFSKHAHFAYHGIRSQTAAASANKRDD